MAAVALPRALATRRRVACGTVGPANEETRWGEGSAGPSLTRMGRDTWVWTDWAAHAGAWS